MSDDEDITRHYHGGDKHSVEAHATTPAAVRATQREAARKFIEACGLHGATCDEYEVVSGVRHQTASARFTELKKAGVIVEIGTRRTRSGKGAGVFVILTAPPNSPDKSAATLKQGELFAE